MDNDPATGAIRLKRKYVQIPMFYTSTTLKMARRNSKFFSKPTQGIAGSKSWQQL
jgi:hypothetical protein